MQGFLELPPLIPIGLTKLGHVSLDPRIRLPSTWRTAIGPVLTNKRIAEYQREGRYGSNLVLPPLQTARPCCACNSTINTRYWSLDYLPKAGVWCNKCRSIHRAKRDKETEQLKRLKELEQLRIVEEYV